MGTCIGEKRLIGVTIFGLFNLLFLGLLNLLYYGYSLLKSFSKISEARILESGGSLAKFRLLMLYVVITSAVYAITGYGVLRSKEKARIALVLFSIIMLILSCFYALYHFEYHNFLLSLCYSALLIYYFTRPKVKEQFK